MTEAQRAWLVLALAAGGWAAGWTAGAVIGLVVPLALVGAVCGFALSRIVGRRRRRGRLRYWRGQAYFDEDE